MKANEDALFSVWKQRRHRLVPDGVVNEEKYLASSKKVLYMLKEVNGGKKNNSDWDLRLFLNGGGRKPTWNNIALWQYGIQNSNENFTWSELCNEKKKKRFRETQLKEIVVINLKKEPGSNSADPRKIWGYSNKDKELLSKQVSIYNPDYIICCGTGDIVKEHKIFEEFETDWQLSKFGIGYYITKSKSVIIDYCHPEARLKDNFLFFPLIETIKEIETKRSLTE